MSCCSTLSVDTWFSSQNLEPQLRNHVSVEWMLSSWCSFYLIEIHSSSSRVHTATLSWKQIFTKKNMKLNPLWSGFTTCEWSNQCSKTGCPKHRCVQVIYLKTPRPLTKPRLNSAQNSKSSLRLRPECSPRFLLEPIRGNTRPIGSRLKTDAARKWWPTYNPFQIVHSLRNSVFPRPDLMRGLARECILFFLPLLLLLPLCLFNPLSRFSTFESVSTRSMSPLTYFQVASQRAYQCWEGWGKSASLCADWEGKTLQYSCGQSPPSGEQPLRYLRLLHSNFLLHQMVGFFLAPNRVLESFGDCDSAACILHVCFFKSPPFTSSNIWSTWRLTHCLSHVINLLYDSCVGGYCPRQCACTNFLLAYRTSALLASLSSHIFAQEGLALHSCRSVRWLIFPSECQVDQSPFFLSNLP